MGLLRRVLRLLAVMVALLVALAGVAVIAVETRWFKDWLRGYLVREAAQYVNGSLTIDRLGGNLFTGVQLEDIKISNDGQDVVTVKSVALAYNPIELVSKGLAVSRLTLDQPILHARHDRTGWSVANVVKKEQSEADRQGPGRPMRIDDIGISNGSVILDDENPSGGVRIPKRVDRIDAKFTFAYEPIHYTVGITHVSFRASEPDLELNGLSGTVSVRDDTVFLKALALRTAETSLSIDGAIQNYLDAPVTKVQIGSDKIALPEIARFVPALDGIPLQPAFELRLDGPLGRLQASLNARSTAGNVRAELVLGYANDRVSADGTVDVERVNLAPWLNRQDLKSDLTGRLTLDVQSALPVELTTLDRSARITTPRIEAAGYVADQIRATTRFRKQRVLIDGAMAAYGSRLSTSGSVAFLDASSHHGAMSEIPVVYDLRGQVDRLNLEAIPYPGTLPRPRTDLNVDYRVRGTRRSLAAETRWRTSMLGHTRIADSSLVNVRMAPGQALYDGDVTLDNLNVAELGRLFNIPTLADARYDTSIAGRTIFSGSGTTLDSLDATADVTLYESRLASGQIPWATISGVVKNRVAQVTAAGQVLDLNPAAFGAPATVDGSVAGSFDVTSRVANIDRGFDPAELQADARIELDPSTVGPLHVDTGKLDGRFENQVAQLQQLTITGQDIHLDVSGALSVGHDTSSNLYFEAGSTELKTIGDAFGVDVSGIGQVWGTVTGDRDRLSVTGNITADGLRYGKIQALTLSSDYTADIPNLSPLGATVHSKNSGTFVVIAGQQINQLDATVDYDQQQINFNATAKQPKRSASGVGSLRLLPDRQEVRLEHLSLQAGNVQWQTPPQTIAKIEYGNDAIAIQDLTLESANQRIDVEGSFGGEDDALTATLTNVELAGVDALLLRPPQLFGRVNATATATGTRERPFVKAEAQVTQGAFRKFQYQELRANVEYRPDGIDLDTRLLQNASAALTAKGFVPSAFYSDAAEGTASKPIDVTVESTGVDLGVLQGLTTALTDVSGGLDAHIRISGQSQSPEATGSVTITNGALTVEPTGVKYHNLNARMDLEGERINLTDFRLSDNDQDQAQLSGALTLHGRTIATMDVNVHSHRIDVLDNELGQLSINSDLHLAGDLAHPKLEGTLAVGTGRLELDRLLATTGNSAYAVKATEYQTVEPDQPIETTGGPGLFSALQIAVDVSVPDDLVLRASDLKAPGSSFGLGAMNLTLGGDLNAQKDPGGPVKLTGSVNTVRGTYEFQGRRFEIRRDGTVRFAGLDQLNPRLDIKARRNIQGVEANVNVEGTLERPRITLSSVPPLEQADILALIVFNQPMNQLGEGQQVSLSQRATSLAEGTVAGQLAGAIGRALNLDTFEIQTAPDSGNGVELTAGQQVGERAYVKLQQGIGDATQSNFVFEYQFLSWLRLETNFLVGSSLQQSLFNRIQDTGADFVIQLPRQKR
jgi:autotransporter translocation and assembly factor TamB